MEQLNCACLPPLAWRLRSRRSVRRLRGRINSIDMSKDMITLDNGSSFMTPKGVKLSDFRVVEKVTVSYPKAGDKVDATSTKPAT
jgi:hypothetical protein